MTIVDPTPVAAEASPRIVLHAARLSPTESRELAARLLVLADEADARAINARGVRTTVVEGGGAPTFERGGLVHLLYSGDALYEMLQYRDGLMTLPAPCGNGHRIDSAVAGDTWRVERTRFEYRGRWVQWREIGPRAILLVHADDVHLLESETSQVGGAGQLAHLGTDPGEV